MRSATAVRTLAKLGFRQVFSLSGGLDGWRKDNLPVVTDLHARYPAAQIDWAVADDVKIRPADLYESSGHRQAGVVLVGDAFKTTCPVTGTGTDKVFTDVERLCRVHIPQWLATAGMGAEKIAAFYDDPVKQACDDWSIAKAWNFKSVTIEPGQEGFLVAEVFYPGSCLVSDPSAAVQGPTYEWETVSVDARVLGRTTTLTLPLPQRLDTPTQPGTCPLEAFGGR